MKKDVDFLFEIGTLRYIDRTWRQFLGPDVANVTEHCFRVIWIALILAKHEKIKNLDRVVRMALVHDIAETRTGDVQYMSRLYTSRNEGLAINDALNGTSVSEFRDDWEAYKKRDSVEATVVKDADTLDVELELQEQKFRGEKLKQLWGERRRAQVRRLLYTKSAKKLWDLIEQTNPHRWHRFGRNRHTKGDWSKIK